MLLHCVHWIPLGGGEESSVSGQLRIRRRLPSAGHTPSPARALQLKRTRTGSVQHHVGQRDLLSSAASLDLFLSLLTAFYARGLAARPGPAPFRRIHRWWFLHCIYCLVLRLCADENLVRGVFDVCSVLCSGRFFCTLTSQTKPRFCPLLLDTFLTFIVLAIMASCKNGFFSSLITFSNNYWHKHNRTHAGSHHWHNVLFHFFLMVNYC